MTHWFDIVMVPLQIFIFLFTVYYFLIGFWGLVSNVYARYFWIALEEAK